MKIETWLILAALVASGCNDKPVQRGADDPDPTAAVCAPKGENVRLPTERELCVYRQPIVIETGFSCPVLRAERNDFDAFSTCSSFPRLHRIEIDFLVDRFGTGSGWVFSDPSVQPPETDKLDLLWVIDNSGSMGQEQKMLRENFAEFVAELASRKIDLHMAITTTQMTDDYPLEPVAHPGAFQATPQPVPGFDRDTHLAVDEMGEPIPGDYQPIRDAIEVAVGCMETPDESYLAVTDAEIECALYPAAGCTISGRCEGDCTPDMLFPDPATYRQLPPILKSSDYVDGAGADVDAMTRDFACMSLVGTRGHGIEKGLGAAVRAVSPELLAGMNAGFLRDDARFAVMFVTDENDCTHDGSLDELSVCAGDACEFANVAGGEADSPLVPVYDIKLELMQNLELAKGREVAETEVFVASIHGTASRFEGPIPSESECAADDYAPVGPSCATALGRASSGDRYERFLLQFAPGNFFPAPQGSTQEMAGWMCRGDFSPAVTALGEWLGRALVE